jgi:hypothetical protein
MGPLAVLITLVAGHDYDGAHRRSPPHGVEEMGRAHHVGGKRPERIVVRAPDQGLRRQVEHDLRLGGLEGRFQRREIPEVADRGPHSLGDLRILEQGRPLGCERKA